MKLFPSESIQSKITLIMVLVAGLATFFTSVTFVIFDLYRFNTELTAEIQNLTDVVGSNSKSAVEFMDSNVAQESLDSLKNDPRILAAYIYTASGERLASIERNSSSFSLNQLSNAEKPSFLKGGYKSFQEPILLDGKEIGKVFLVSDISQFKNSVMRYIAVVVLILTINFLIIYLLSVSFQKFISGPILNLAGLVKKVSDKKDYSIRAEKQSNDEIGYLVDQFNQMLGNIQQRDQDLQTVQTELEGRVKERTDELEKEVYERKRVSEVLRESQKMLNLVMDNIPQAIYWKDNNSVYLGCNKTFANHAGLKYPSDIFGKSEDEMPWSETEKKEYLEAELKVYRNGEPQYQNIDTQTRAEKQAIIEINRIPLFDTENNIIGLLGTYEDITDRKAMEEDLTRAQKLESLGILAGGIAHDFNNLLTGILGNITFARSLLHTGEDITDRLKDAEFASLRARDLTMQLLTFAKGGEPIKRVAKIEDLLNQSVNLALRGSNVFSTYDIEENVWPVKIDEGQITQVINNIVINSNQAMPDGGELKIEVRNIEIPANSRINLDKGKYVRVKIEDAGIGIPEEHIDKIFDPYFTTKKEGHGLGLTSCYSIIKKHSGSIHLNSELGKGSEFIFYLPAVSEYIAEQPEKRVSYESKGGKILFMDDEEIIKNIAKEMLESEGFNVVLASEGREAIDKYRQSVKSNQKFDLVILDLTVPGGLGGKDTIREILKIDPDVKAIVSSGYSNDPVMAEFEKFGFSDFVPKPYNSDQLIDKVNKVIST